METQSHSHTLYHRDQQTGQLTGTWTATLTPYGLKVTCGECGRFFGYEAFGATNLPQVPDSEDVPRRKYFIERLDPREYAFHPANAFVTDES